MIEIGKSYENGHGWKVEIVAKYHSAPHDRYIGIAYRSYDDPIVRVYTDKGKQLQHSDGTGGVSPSDKAHLRVPELRYIVVGRSGRSDVLRENPLAPDYPSPSQSLLALTYEEGLLKSVEILKANTKAKVE